MKDDATRRLVLLGSTGSIGTQTIDVIDQLAASDRRSMSLACLLAMIRLHFVLKSIVSALISLA